MLLEIEKLGLLEIWTLQQCLILDFEIVYIPIVYNYTVYTLIFEQLKKIKTQKKKKNVLLFRFCSKMPPNPQITVYTAKKILKSTVYTPPKSLKIVYNIQTHVYRER